ncbi:MAG TPA: L,D-transpeptidase [Xanthobacteraceae bacterium]|nr:L,D-transpeptidase [Xanthobacteraceae bacterium]
MQRIVLTALLASALGTGSAIAAPLSPQPQTPDPLARPTAGDARDARYAAAPRPGSGGGGFIAFLFGGPNMAPPDPYAPRYQTGRNEPPEWAQARQTEADPRYRRQMVDYRGSEKAGTIIIDTPNRFLFLVQDNGHAVRYGIGVGRPGFTWAGVKQVSAKREWPDWTPPDDMLRRRPDLPHHMSGGPENPLGARALYLGSSLYRIHGSNEPWTIGTAVSSGCIRMRNEDVIDLYGRVGVGTKVVVI